MFLVGFVSGIYLAVFVSKRFVKTGVLHVIFVRGGYRMATFIALGSVIATFILYRLPLKTKQSAWLGVVVLFLFISFITIVFGLRLWKIEKKLQLIE